MIEPQIRLADWIAAMRAELAQAAIVQQQREAQGRQLGIDPDVPPLRVKEVRLELEVASETVSANSASGKAGLGIRFWVVSSVEVTGSHEQKRQLGTTQRLSLILEPTVDLDVGTKGERELLK